MPPDFRYRPDFRGGYLAQQPIAPPSIPPFPNMSRTDAIKQFNQATNFYRDYNYKGLANSRSSD